MIELTGKRLFSDVCFLENYVMEKKKKLFCIAKLLEIVGVLIEWSTPGKRLF